MARRPDLPDMTLFARAGERKYLVSAERADFLAAASQLPDPALVSFCALLHWTGCRPSEARAVRARHIDRGAGAVVLRSLKKRGTRKNSTFRAVPVPDEFLEELARVHDLSADPDALLWPFSRTTAWRIVNGVMTQAGLSGPKACAKGLRHAFGVHAVLNDVPVTRIKVWLGHKRLETTAIYLDVAAAEDRALAARMWREPERQARRPARSRARPRQVERIPA